MIFQPASKKPTIFISGASGYIGRHLCSALAAQEYNVIGATRSPQGAEVVSRLGVQQVVCPPIEESRFSEALTRDVDIVIHLAAHVHKPFQYGKSVRDKFHAVNVLGTRNAAKLASRCSASFFFLLSTVAVYGDRSSDGPFDTASPTRPLTPYAKSKLEAELAAKKALAGTDTRLRIIRIPMVYGENAPGNFSKLCRLIATGLPLPLATALSKRSLLFIDNLVDAIQTAVAAPSRCPNLALIADDAAISTAELVKQLISAIGSRTILFPFPKQLLKAASILTRQHAKFVSLFEPLEIDAHEFRSSMCWTPPHKAEVAIANSVKRVIDTRLT